MIIKSIRWRLQLWLAFLLLCLLSGFGITAYQLNRISRFSQLDEELRRRVALVSTDVRGRLPFPPPMFRPPPGDANPGPRPRPEFHGRDRRQGPPPNFEEIIRNVSLADSTLTFFPGIDPADYYYAIWSRDEDLLRASSNAPPALSLPISAEGDTSTQFRTSGRFREAYHFTELRECILVGRSVEADLWALRRFAWVLLGVGAVVLAVGLGGGWFMTSRALQPIEKIGAAAARISSGNLSQRIDISETEGELGRLASVLNSTFARLEAAFAQQRQFTGDASHELRTPLAVLISEAQTALARERTPAEYRETLQACLQTAQQMRRLAESLMKLARFDAGQETLDLQPFDLAQVAGACLELVRPLAEHQQLILSTRLSPVQAIGDPDRVGQVITNLLSNAVQFTPPQGRIELSTSVENGLAVVRVTDTGQGIDPEDLPHVFERFYRADRSRSRRDGHAGLGLAISKAIMEAHGGSISVTTQLGAGTTFTVHLPLSRTSNR